MTICGRRTAGVYFNIGETSEISAERVAWNDYAVDVVVTPDGTTRVVDEEELPPDVNVAVRELVATTRARILAGVTSLVREVEAEARRLLAPCATARGSAVRREPSLEEREDDRSTEREPDQRGVDARRERDRAPERLARQRGRRDGGEQAEGHTDAAARETEERRLGEEEPRPSLRAPSARRSPRCARRPR